MRIKNNFGFQKMKSDSHLFIKIPFGEREKYEGISKWKVQNKKLYLNNTKI